MPRRHFQADLANAIQGVEIAGIVDVQPGSDDGEFTFMYPGDGQQLRISVLIPELSDYPSAHPCVIFVPDDAPPTVAAALDNISGAARGRTIMQILELVSSTLHSMEREGDCKMLNFHEFSKSDDDDDDDDNDDDYEMEEYFPGEEDLDPRPIFSNDISSVSRGYTEATSAFRQRLRDDLLTVKREGFRTGQLGSIIDGLACYVSVSIRISKLGLSEEAMQAWQMKPSEYLIAILHYPDGYKNMDDVKTLDLLQARRSFGIRIGISTHYKPTIQEAVMSFTVFSSEKSNQVGNSPRIDSQQPTTRSTGFRNSFISGPLNEMMDQRFHMILKYRHSGMPWSGAEAYYNDQLNNAVQIYQESTDGKYYAEDTVRHAWPKIVTNDHISSVLGQHHSLPLVAMQFALRHFVRCTEFCLICFNKMPEDLQAIKPYVCDNPLCLYQYMSLGFGPSIEHEILSQPKVVDLLISFCYTSARMGRLRDFPTGLSLSVPPTVIINGFYTRPQPSQYTDTQSLMEDISTPIGANEHVPPGTRFCEKHRELLFDDITKPCPVKNGQWVVIRTEDSPIRFLHCRITDISSYPVVRLSEIIHPAVPERTCGPDEINRTGRSEQAASSKPPLALSDKFRTVSFHDYSENFDNMVDGEKRQTIVTLLDLLPSVQEMKTYLLRKPQSSLSAWIDRLSPAVIGILRWIIASNRACILQVDTEESATSKEVSQDRLYGMPGWEQFRFAMGAPDKERRFVTAVRETTQRLDLKYPTLFAWHGSPIENWHSIIREGLHFNETRNGRAYGNGVYHATSANISLGFARRNSILWSTSELKIQQAMALDEIVNAPAEFVSQSPHLVVAQLDWIQTRYLFVRTRISMDTISPDPGSKPLKFVEQDPTRTPYGIYGPLIIPLHAFAASRRPNPILKTKRRTASITDGLAPAVVEDDEESDATDEEDLAVFRDEDDLARKSPGLLPILNLDNGKGKLMSLESSENKRSDSHSTKPVASLTDYVPGSLNYATLPMLATPAWASSSATNRLMKDFRDLMEVQKKEPLHELGWHVDEDKMENMYQWIVELHSFEPTLPLAQDMKAKNINSIVLEMRFCKEYPITPPFVRIIRPRFLPFSRGGGGHVTSGGAICLELLTNNGWSAASSMESVLLQVRMAICSDDPRPARLHPLGPPEYGIREAVDAYVRACSLHGWLVPPGFRDLARGPGR